MRCDGVTLLVKFSSGSLDLFLSEGRMFSQHRENDVAFGCLTGLVSHMHYFFVFLFCFFLTNLNIYLFKYLFND